MVLDEVEQNDRVLSVASKSIICRSRKLRQIINLRDTDKSRYFVFLMNILGKICHFHERAVARRRKARFPLRMRRILFSAQHLSPTQLDGIAHEQTIICRQLFAGHVVGSRPMKRCWLSQANVKQLFFSKTVKRVLYLGYVLLRLVTLRPDL